MQAARSVTVQQAMRIEYSLLQLGAETSQWFSYF